MLEIHLIRALLLDWLATVASRRAPAARVAEDSGQARSDSTGRQNSELRSQGRFRTFRWCRLVSLPRFSFDMSTQVTSANNIIMGIRFILKVQVHTKFCIILRRVSTVYIFMPCFCGCVEKTQASKISIRAHFKITQMEMPILHQRKNEWSWLCNNLVTSFPSYMWLKYNIQVILTFEFALDSTDSCGAIRSIFKLMVFML